MSVSAPVSDWMTDYDIFDPRYVNDPFPIWDEMRERCPVAHSDRWGGSYNPTRYADVTAIARDIEKFPSGGGIAVVPPPMTADGQPVPQVLPYGVPPISSDPPLHTWTRRLILPWMSPQKTLTYEAMTRDLCNRLIDGFIETGRADVAADYAQQIPVRVIAHILGVPESMSDSFTGWVRDVLEFAYDAERRQRGMSGVITFFQGALAERRENPGDDLISELLHTEIDGQPIEDSVILGMCALLLVAGVDTTWSSIGSSLWHLASHPDDLARLVSEPELLPTAVEEFLRAYAPVTMARRLLEDTEYNGCPMKAGERILMNFPAANRDPEAFDRPEEVLIDRQENRHVAFGAGIHRCAGSNLARMELRVSIETFMARIPEFTLVDPSAVTWAGGQVRGPRSAVVAFTPR
ncbi:MAG: cytochrome P450 [Actinomycetota bacterium]|nr:cytochrome P450 [Actinomycetota bacterium]MDA2971291.1 cytochrome P450 [Actinomycetota bacterium]MDA3001718.1 cytochrome P450 [Actinomycetota bacterium]